MSTIRFCFLSFSLISYYIILLIIYFENLVELRMETRFTISGGNLFIEDSSIF